MIKDSVVFVLGAGASVPFGFPCGSDLVSEILRIRKEDVPDRLNGLMCDAVCELMGFDKLLMKDFQMALKHSQVQSIDDFLAQPIHQRFLQIGRFLIAGHLIPKEEHDRLFAEGEGPNKNWYRFVWLHLSQHGSFEALSNDAKVTFVSFNYDRSLEHYLMNVFRFHWGTPSGKTTAFLAKNIFHVHGMLGAYRNAGEGPARSYTTQCDIEAIKRAMQGIKIIHEVDKFPRQVEIKERIENADRVVFLGFQYQTENLNKLLRGLTKRNPNLKVLGSCFGLSDMESAGAKRKIAEVLNISVSDVAIGGCPLLGCHDYLRENFETD